MDWKSLQKLELERPLIKTRKFSRQIAKKKINSKNTNTNNNDDKKQHKIMYAQVRHYVILTLPISIMKKNKEMPV